LQYFRKNIKGLLLMSKMVDALSVLCPVCCSSSDFHEEVLRIDEYPLHIKGQQLQMTLNIAICKECGLIFQNPRAEDKIFQEYYQFGSQYKRPDYNQGQDLLRKIQKDFVEKNVKDKGALLDVGCGSGYFLELLKKEGWDVCGIEPSSEACKIAKEDFDINVFHGGVENYHDEKMFDVIALRHSIEHFCYPKEVLNKTIEFLKPDGLLFLELQDVSVINEELIDYFYFEHLFYLTPVSVTNLLNVCGLEVIHLQQSSNPKGSDSPYGVIRLLAKRNDNIASDEFVSDYKNMKDKLNDYFKNIRKKFDVETNAGIIYEKLRDAPRKMAIWGASWHTVFLQKILGYNFQVDSYIDSNIEKIGTAFLGKPVIAPQEIKDTHIDEVLISSQAFEEEIYCQLLNLNFPKERIYRIYEHKEI